MFLNLKDQICQNSFRRKVDRLKTYSYETMKLYEHVTINRKVQRLNLFKNNHKIDGLKTY